MMERAMRPALIAAAALALGTAPLSAQPAAVEDIVIAMPNFTFTGTPNYIAEDLGLWAKHGLRAKIIQIAGVGATNAVIAGSADFVHAGGSTLTRAASRGQRLLAIATTTERNIVIITMRKEVAEAAGFDAKAPLEKRAAVLRGRTFGVGSINAAPHAYLLAVASRGGVKPDELRVTALEGNAMMAAFQARQIDGMSNSPPWPLKPVIDGASVVIASGPDGDPPNAINFAYNVIVAKPETCEKRRHICVAMGAVMKEAIAYMHTHPAEVLAILARRFPNLEPKLIAAAYAEILKSTPKVPVVTREALDNADDFNVEAGMMKAGDKLKSYDGLYTDEFVK
jgi:ABC-type nitrate/sulfonate/bicarbonate transport system substrate-binding protein